MNPYRESSNEIVECEVKEFGIPHFGKHWNSYLHEYVTSVSGKYFLKVYYKGKYYAIHRRLIRKMYWMQQLFVAEFQDDYTFVSYDCGWFRSNIILWKFRKEIKQYHDKLLTSSG